MQGRPFRESDALRRVFEGVVAMCIGAGLVGGEAFSIDASLIKADVNKTKRIPGDQPFSWPKAEEASHAVREYLVALDAARGLGGSWWRRRFGRRWPAAQASQRSLAYRSASDMGCEAGPRPILCLRCELPDRQQSRHHHRCCGQSGEPSRGDCCHPDHGGAC